MNLKITHDLLSCLFFQHCLDLLKNFFFRIAEHVVIRLEVSFFVYKAPAFIGRVGRLGLKEKYTSMVVLIVLFINVG